MKKFLLTIAIISFTVSAFAGSTPPPEEDPAPIPVNAMFENYVAIGDSLTHGFQSGAVDETRQPDSYPARLANLMNTAFVQGELEFPGYFANLEDYGKDNISYWDYPSILAGTSGDRADDYADQSKMNNFGITGADVTTIQDTDGSEGGFYERVLGSNGAPALDQALDKNPTFMSLFIGNNDNLGAAMYLDTASLTEYSTFQQKFMALVSRVASKSSIEGVVIANLPDATAIPYLVPVENPNLPEGSMQPFWADEATDIEDVLTPSEMQTIKSRVAQFNALIENSAVANGWAIFDANTFFNDVKEYGYVLKDGSGNATSRVMSADYLGGLFSLDGVHMSSTGYAVAANCFAGAINSYYGTELGYVNEYQASENDTLYKNPYDPREWKDAWYGDILQWMIGLFL